MPSSRQSELARSCLRVRFTYELFTATAGAAGPQTRTAYLVNIDDPYWVTFDDGETVPYRIPRNAIKKIEEL